MTVDAALARIVRELVDLRDLNDRLMADNERLERDVVDAVAPAARDARRAYRVGYRAGHYRGRQGQDALPEPERAARGDLGALMRYPDDTDVA